MVIAMHDAKTISFRIEAENSKNKMNFTMFFEFKGIEFHNGF